MEVFALRAPGASEAVDVPEAVSGGSQFLSPAAQVVVQDPVLEARLLPAAVFVVSFQRAPQGNVFRYAQQ